MKNVTKTHEIEKNIPVPTTHYNIKYPFDDMEIGDSFIVNTERERRHVMCAWNGWIERSVNGKNKKFTSRRVGDNEYRIWRIK